MVGLVVGLAVPIGLAMITLLGVTMTCIILRWKRAKRTGTSLYIFFLKVFIIAFSGFHNEGFSSIDHDEGFSITINRPEKFSLIERFS